MKKQAIDRLHRPLQDVRISITDQCNFRCTYCMPKEIFDQNYPFLKKDERLSIAEIKKLTDLFATIGVKKVRITGGEPLLRTDVAEIIAEINKNEQITDIALTTNGILLPKYAKKLKRAGLKRVNISLDSLNDEVFGKMNGKGIKPEQIIAGIDAAASAGLTVKVNMVVKKGVNDREVLEVARVFREKGHTLRFIEYMDVGNTNGWKLGEVVPYKEIIQAIQQEARLVPVEQMTKGEVAKRYRYENSKTEVGFITSVTESFCTDCTRARISADGKLYTCLFATKGFDLREILNEGTDEAILARITSIWSDRDDRYSELRLHNSQKGKKVEMSRIGG